MLLLCTDAPSKSISGISLFREDFAPADRKWAEAYISASTAMPERLAESPRWVIFHNDRFWVVGVACMMRDLIGMPVAGEDDITRDKMGRPLYLFAGYVALYNPTTRIVIPPYSASLERFRPLAHVVRQRWRERSFEVNRDPLAPYRDIAELHDFDLPPLTQKPCLNDQARPQVALWLESQREAVWMQAASLPHPPSLCLGLPNVREALEGVFLNATVAEVTGVADVTKPVLHWRRHIQILQPDRSFIKPGPMERIEDPRRQPATYSPERVRAESLRPVAPSQILGYIVCRYDTAGDQFTSFTGESWVAKP